MKTHSDNAVTIPPGLLAEVQAAAREEHRAPDELVSDALRRYLHDRPQKKEHAPRKNLAQLLMESPFAGAELSLERRKD